MTRAQAASALCALVAAGRVWDFEKDVGGLPDDDSDATYWKNGGLVNETLAKLERGDTLLFPNKTFHMMGGIQATGLDSVTLQFEGTIIYSGDYKKWPRKSNSTDVTDSMYFDNCSKLTITSTGKALFDGQGASWWGLPGVGYLERGENRPKLFKVENSTDTLVENIILKNSAYWTFEAKNVTGFEARWVDIDARRTTEEKHTTDDLTAFNTDGFDVSGSNVYIHDCNIWNQDDCIAVKDDSENMIFERINASGLGLTIGSIGGGHYVRNVTFRNCYMKNTFKGIYIKPRNCGDPANITDVLYENIVMDEPEQWAIWIAPAQQSDSVDLCAAHPCSICWPEWPFAKCDAPFNMTMRNVVLRNITINNPKKSPGVIMGNKDNPIQGLVFDNVVVNNPGDKPWGKDMYKCEGVEGGVATGGTTPVPPCFKSTQ